MYMVNIIKHGSTRIITIQQVLLLLSKEIATFILVK